MDICDPFHQTWAQRGVGENLLQLAHLWWGMTPQGMSRCLVCQAGPALKWILPTPPWPALQGHPECLWGLVKVWCWEPPTRTYAGVYKARDHMLELLQAQVICENSCSEIKQNDRCASFFFSYMRDQVVLLLSAFFNMNALWADLSLTGLLVVVCCWPSPLLTQ